MQFGINRFFFFLFFPLLLHFSRPNRRSWSGSSSGSSLSHSPSRSHSLSRSRSRSQSRSSSSSSFSRSPSASSISSFSSTGSSTSSGSADSEHLYRDIASPASSRGKSPSHRPKGMHLILACSENEQTKVKTTSIKKCVWQKFLDFFSNPGTF